MIRNNQRYLFVAAAAVLFLGVSCKFSKQIEVKKKIEAPPDATPDAKILAMIHRTNAIEIEAGLLAQKKGQSEKVRKLGVRIARDHLSAEKKVLDLAQKQGTEVDQPSGRTPQEEKQHTKQAVSMYKLRKLQGPEFDPVFLQFMEQGHTDSIEMLKASRDQLHDEEVQDLVNQLIPTLEEHHELAAHLEGHK
jgi:putative membrane protein